MVFPDDSKVGDFFFIDDELVLITEWNYILFNAENRYFDLYFIDASKSELEAVCCMSVIPMEYDFHGAFIRRVSPLEQELFSDGLNVNF